MTPENAIWIVIIAEIVYAVGVIWIVFKLGEKKPCEQETYNFSPAQKTYFHIACEIKDIKNECDLYACYMDLVLFEFEYGLENAGLVSKLEEMYEKKEIEIAKYEMGKIS